ncbi:MAG: oxidoreductase [Spirochaetes bacterium RIFOXYC1_FULL_54_7]|nr:MAG: oxidoreductase [Spirochaetes bacterium RIFOXYC1_FULL_54_7]
MSTGFGVIGTGMIAAFHAKALQAIPSARLVASYDNRPGAAASFGSSHGGRAYDSLDRFLADPELQVVTICTPSGMHLEPALAAIEAGKHVIVEKPIEITLERCDRMIEAADKQGVKLAGIFPSRFHDVSKVIKAQIDDGRFGRLSLGDAYVKWFRSEEYYRSSNWKGTWKYDGGGALMNQSIHAVDLLQWFMGPVESVQACAATIGHEGIEVEDTAVAVLRYANGALGVIEGSTAVYPGFLKRLEISGTTGSVIMEEEDITTWSFAEIRPDDDAIRSKFANTPTSGGGAADPGAIGFHGHQHQFEDFLRVLESGKGKPLVDGLEARKAVAIIVAIYESARTGRLVKMGAGS